MFNNINDNSNGLFNKAQLEQQANILNLNALRANMKNNAYTNGKQSIFVDKTEISANAIKLFERDCDISKFNKIAMSDPNDFSHIDQVKELFKDGIIDPFEDDVLQSLVTNPKLLDDLGL